VKQHGMRRRVPAQRAATRRPPIGRRRDAASTYLLASAPVLQWLRS
jgi:hypothetical protein